MDDMKKAPVVPGPSTSPQDDEDVYCNLQEVDVSKPLLQLQLILRDPSWFVALRTKMAPPAPEIIITSRSRMKKTSMEVQQQCQTLISEKLKASNFPISSISIGAWKRVSGRVEGELTAKIYFAKRKLVWEFIDGHLKSKMEFSFSDIIAIRDVILPHQPSILEIELSNPPLFFRELTPQPRKHTNWQQTSDFTDGQASHFRRHYVIFPPGALDKHYEKLLQCDLNLLVLSKRPFPRHRSPHFDAVPAPLPAYNTSEGPTLVFQHQPQLHYPITPMPPPPPPPSIHPTLNPLINQELGFVNFPCTDEIAARNLNIHNQPSMWENHQTAGGFLNDARFVVSPPAEEMQVLQQQQQPPYHHFCYDEPAAAPPPPPPMAPEECYGCDVDSLPPFYPDFDLIIPPTTSYGLSPDDEQVMMMQNDQPHHHYSLMIPSPPPLPPPPQPYIQDGRSRGFGYESSSDVEDLEQILYSNHGIHDDHVQAQHSRRDL